MNFRFLLSFLVLFPLHLSAQVGGYIEKNLNESDDSNTHAPSPNPGSSWQEAIDNLPSEDSPSTPENHDAEQTLRYTESILPNLKAETLRTEEQIREIEALKHQIRREMAERSENMEAQRKQFEDKLREIEQRRVEAEKAREEWKAAKSIPRIIEQVDKAQEEGRYRDLLDHLDPIKFKQNRTDAEQALYEQYFDSSGRLLVRDADYNRLFSDPLKSDPNSLNGREIRDTININSAFIARYRHLAQYDSLSGRMVEVAEINLVGLMIADHFESIGLTQLADEILTQLGPAGVVLRGSLNGVKVGLRGTIDSVSTIVTQPVESAAALAYAIVNYEETAKAIANAVEEKWEAYLAGDLETRSQIIGQLTFEIGGDLVAGVGLATKLVKVTKVAFLTKKASLLLPDVPKWSLSETISKIDEFSPGELAKILDEDPQFLTQIIDQLGGRGRDPRVIAGATKFRNSIDYADELGSGREVLREMTKLGAQRANGFYGRSLIGKTYSHHFGAAEKAFPLTDNIASSFGSKRYTEIVPQGGEVFYRIGGPEGSYWSRFPSKSRLDGMNQLAILDQWNKFDEISVLIVPEGMRGIRIFEGAAGSQGGRLVAKWDDVDDYLPADSLKDLVNRPFHEGLRASSPYFSGGGNQIFINRSLVEDLLKHSAITSKSVSPNADLGKALQTLENWSR